MIIEDVMSVPAEWAPQKAIWTAWPADASEWNGDLETPRRDVAAMVRALGATNNVRVLVNGRGSGSLRPRGLGRHRRARPRALRRHLAARHRTDLRA